MNIGPLLAVIIVAALSIGAIVEYVAHAVYLGRKKDNADQKFLD